MSSLRNKVNADLLVVLALHTQLAPGGCADQRLFDDIINLWDSHTSLESQKTDHSIFIYWYAVYIPGLCAFTMNQSEPCAHTS